MKYWSWKTVVRLAISGLLVAQIEKEAGFYTALAMILIAVALEIIAVTLQALTYSVAVLTRRHLEQVGAFTESLLKNETSGKIDA